ncbi:RICIN domain-containing protein [Streptomyces sp. BE303]|uniref:RICIN domain-containing protein n=1 Tax=Streptomyces sp. BE303 TaxID=3002528 RepID=UPI002E767430|nr:hypothetical protein [Streptomyces sp. BE303]MED7949222.1 hypothetical protein [Streptomyces sp. BE303]
MSSRTSPVASGVRVDGLGSWIQQVRATEWTTPLVNANSHQCLEIEDSLTTDGAAAQQWVFSH